MIRSRLSLKLLGDGLRGRFCSTETPVRHVPVMARETVEYLKPKDGELYIDMTFGAGGHTRAILEAAPKAKIVALDRDPVAYGIAQNLAERYPAQIFPILGKFSELPERLNELEIKQNGVDGMIFDFGASSMQFDEDLRGFSISKNGPLDMRMDRDRFPDEPSAADVLSEISQEDLARILKAYGEEKHAKQIARAIVETRHTVKKIETTKELADLVKACCGNEKRLDKLQRVSHPATKTFQALRIFVNNELNEINYAMLLAKHYLKLGGKMITITFHSLEDIIVKRHVMGNVMDDMANKLPLRYNSHTICHDKEVMEQVMQSPWHQLTKPVAVPSYEEVEDNPRSRSAKLRAVVRVS